MVVTLQKTKVRVHSYGCPYDKVIENRELDDLQTKKEAIEELARESWELMYEEDIHEKRSNESSSVMSLDDFKDMYREQVKEMVMENYQAYTSLI